MRYENVGRPMEILLVEDSLADARLAIEALRDGDVKHRLTLIRDGLEAHEFLYREAKFAQAPRPDLILLDLNLPGMHGRELLEEIKADFDLRDIPVVILTASADQEDLHRSEFLRVESYLTKPVDIDKFLGVVRDLKRYWHADVILPGEVS